jgi:hypothetical protein
MRFDDSLSIKGSGFDNSIAFLSVDGAVGETAEVDQDILRSDVISCRCAVAAALGEKAAVLGCCPLYL